MFLLASIAARVVGCGPLLIIQRGPKKWGHRLMTIILSSLNRFKKKIFTGKFLGKFVVKWILALPLHLARLPCETSMSAKQVINDKLQCSNIPVAEDVTLAARSADISLLSGFLFVLCSLT